MIDSRSSPLTSLLKGFNQLLEEFEFFSAGSAMQSMRLMMARNSPCAYPQAVTSDTEEEQFKAVIHKYQNTAVYEYLKTPHLGKI
jgi:hypothetical protein